MAAAGVPRHIRAAWCGHSEEVNEETYTHARDEDLAAAGDTIGDIFKPVRQGCAKTGPARALRTGPQPSDP
jgi:hypothetical protein